MCAGFLDKCYIVSFPFVMKPTKKDGAPGSGGTATTPGWKAPACHPGGAQRGSEDLSPVFPSGDTTPAGKAPRSAPSVQGEPPSCDGAGEGEH